MGSTPGQTIADAPVMQYTAPSNLQATNADDAKVLHLAQTLYGEFAGVKDRDLQAQYMTMAASAANNTFGRGEWKHQDWDTHLYKRFDAVSGMNQPYKQALKGDFKTDAEKYAWKKSMQIAYGVTNGHIARDKAEFYWTPKEYKAIAGGPALPHPELLEKVATVGQYNTYRYKTKKQTNKQNES